MLFFGDTSRKQRRSMGRNNEGQRMKEIMENIGMISFISIDEIYSMRKKAREVYATFDEDTREVYKWYFYHQLCLLQSKHTNLKDLMWLYVCGQNVSKDLNKEYYDFCCKRKKMR